MYIKFEKNIYNISNLNSVNIRDTGTIFGIDLVKGKTHIVLHFENLKIREYIMSKIWEKLVLKEKTFDLDKEIELFKNTDKYNL